MISYVRDLERALGSAHGLLRGITTLYRRGTRIGCVSHLRVGTPSTQSRGQAYFYGPSYWPKYGMCAESAAAYTRRAQAMTPRQVPCATSKATKIQLHSKGVATVRRGSARRWPPGHLAATKSLALLAR